MLGGLTMRAIPIVISIAAFTLGGCASTVTAWKNDPLQVYDIKGPTVYAMTGDRRTAVLMEANTTKRFCAESLPDAVAAYSAASKANANVQDKASAAIEDATYAGLMQTFQRTEIAEVYRQMGWNLCLAWAQGAITSPEYYALLDKFVTGGLHAISERAEQVQVWPTSPHVTMNVGPGGTVGAAVSTPNKPTEEAKKPAADKKALDLGNDVKLEVASTQSGYCIKAPAAYVGTGALDKPKISDALPRCSAT